MDMEIRFVEEQDFEAWYSLDKHLPPNEFIKKVRDRQGYVLTIDRTIIGILRYNLFWDCVPFCTLLYISESFRSKGYGKQLMYFWENQMRKQGYDWLLTSTQSDENAQHFYRAIGYTDCGNLNAPDQAMELLLGKHLR